MGYQPGLTMGALPGGYTPALARTLTTLLNRWDQSTPILQLDFLIVPQQHSQTPSEEL